jgi:hypothetical protein
MVFRPDRLKSVEEKSELLKNSELTITITGPKYCVGASGVCPYNKIIQNGRNENKCFSCRQGEMTQIMPVNRLNAYQIEDLKNQPHFNYINIFGNQLLKAGVASTINKTKRVLEQGSTATLYFAESDGYKARQIEDFVSMQLRITQHVAWPAKFKLLNEKVDREGVIEVLKSVYTQINQIIPEEFQKSILLEPEYSFNLDYYKFNLPEYLPRLQVVEDIQTGDVISGELIGVFGLILLLHNNKNYYAVNTRSLSGYMIQIEEKVEQVNLKEVAKVIDLKRPVIESPGLF